jgi:predicted dithiol-disulfide oxidoreductase (DUF899 family)
MNEHIEDLLRQIYDLKAELTKARLEVEPEVVQDYTFETLTGPRTLSSLFGDKSDLFIVHNMGKSCAWCTLWADGFSGYLRHIHTRASFVLCSPDAPEDQQKLALARDWKFPLISDQTKEFTTDMGFYTETDGYWPAISAFHKAEDGTITRTGKDIFGPGDDYCMVWPMFGLLKGGLGEWEPRG